MTSKRWRVVALATLLTGACKGRNGDEGPMFERFEAGAMGYSLEYLSPPWTVTESTDSLLELQIDAEVLGTSIDGVPPTHSFRVGPASADDTLRELLGSAYSASLQELYPDVDLDEFATAGFPSTGFPATGFATGLATGFASTGGIPGTGTDTFGDFGTGGIDDLEETLDQVFYLRDVDLGDSRAVARAELNYVLDNHDAELLRDIAAFEGGAEAPLVWSLRVDGIFHARVFYFDAGDTTLRAAFMSIYPLETYEVDYMMSSLRIAGDEEDA